MTNDLSCIPAGTAIAFSEGEYSSFGYIGHIVTLKELDLRAEIETFKAAHQPRIRADRPQPRQFVAWLVAQGSCFPADVTEIHLDSTLALD